jgi:UDP-2-acetamido-2,6-beta-L-arabino-hexul-4-ose reductase
MVERVFITGASGFVGSNLVAHLQGMPEYDVVAISRDTDPETLRGARADHVIHLAGANRPETESGFAADNVGYSETILDLLAPASDQATFIFASTIKVSDDSPYGVSKRGAEQVIEQTGPEKGWNTTILRLPNLFGKWCRPYYNSFVSTFIDQAITGKKISINDPAVEMDLLYIDDLLDTILTLLKNTGDDANFRLIEQFPTYRKAVGYVADCVTNYARTHGTPWLSPVMDTFDKKLHATYLSYLPLDARRFDLTGITSDTGSFCEVFKTEGWGQVSVLTIEPGATRGNHYHHTKCENFHLVAGTVALFEHDVRNDNEQASIISQGNSFWTRPGWVHRIENTGSGTATFLIWANEVFDHKRPDTYPPLALEHTAK